MGIREAEEDRFTGTGRLFDRREVEADREEEVGSAVANFCLTSFLPCSFLRLLRGVWVP